MLGTPPPIAAVGPPAVSISRAQLGNHTVTYECNDQVGQSAVAVTRKIEVVDHTPPAITMKGNHEFQLEMYQEDSASSVWAFLQTDSNVVECEDEWTALAQRWRNAHQSSEGFVNLHLLSVVIRLL